MIHGKIGETVAGVRLDNNTASMNKANGEYIRRQKLQKWEDGSVEFSEKTRENEESITATLWLEQRFNNNTEVRNRRKNRLEMSVQMGTTLSRFTGITLGCVVYQKTSGSPIVGDS